MRKLNENNHRCNIPDPSFDLDGDGVVSGKDYFLARRFDADNDGKLNSYERETALNALNNGIENNFRWGLEKEGCQRSTRILQVRGQIVDAENFGVIKDTYPKHPLSELVPSVSTLRELHARRKANDMYF